MADKFGLVYNNLQLSSTNHVYSLYTNHLEQILIKHDPNTFQKLASYKIPKEEILTGFKIIKKNNFTSQDLIIITGASFIVVLDQSLKKEIWKLDAYNKKYTKIVSRFYVFQGVTCVQNGLIFGTLTSEIFVLELFRKNTSSEKSNEKKEEIQDHENEIEILNDPQLKGIHKFKFTNTSISEISSLNEEAWPSNPPEKNKFEFLVAFSNSRFLKILISSNLKTLQIISSFEFRNNFSSINMTRFIQINNEMIIVTGDINGSVSMISYNSFASLSQFTLFSKSVTCMSIKKNEEGNYELFAGSNDGYGRCILTYSFFDLF